MSNELHEQDSFRKHRWGMLRTYPKFEDKQQWEDFDHSKTLNLTDSGSTSIVYHKHTSEGAVLRFRAEKDCTSEQKQLAEMTYRSSSQHGFLPVLCVFRHRSSYYVGSGLSDISLEDIVECSIPLDEGHVSTILFQVGAPRRLLELLLTRARLCKDFSISMKTA